VTVERLRTALTAFTDTDPGDLHALARAAQVALYHLRRCEDVCVVPEGAATRFAADLGDALVALLAEGDDHPIRRLQEQARQVAFLAGLPPAIVE
jgi:hypothetical protein